MLVTLRNSFSRISSETTRPHCASTTRYLWKACGKVKQDRCRSFMPKFVSVSQARRLQMCAMIATLSASEPSCILGFASRSKG